jgi:oligogalacturonide lyase
MRRRAFLKTAAAALGAPAILANTGSSERKLHIDPETGARVWQITAFPTVNQNLYFHSRCWTADGRTFIFQSLREASRSSRADLYRCNVDGMGLERITDNVVWGNFALHPKKPVGYFNTGNEIFAVEIDTKKIERVGVVEGDGTVGGGPGSMTDDGRLYSFVWTSDRTSGFGVLDTESGESRKIPLGVKGRFTHLQIEPGDGKSVQFCGDSMANGGVPIFVADMNGRVERLPFEQANGHNAWLGATGKVYTNQLGENRDILVMKPGTANVEIVAKSPPRFWHAGVSPEGEWMVSDTLNPDEGLHLICVKTGKHAPLCRAGSSQGHSQYTHPHPSVSPGGRHVLFNSDRTGVPHVYVAEIPETLRASLAS